MSANFLVGVAVDHSDEIREPIMEYLAQIKKPGMKIFFVNAYKAISLSALSVPCDTMDKLLNQVNARIAENEKIENHYKRMAEELGIPASFEFVVNQPSVGEALLKKFEELNVHQIIMSKRNISNAQAKLFGRNSIYISQRSKIPVTIVPIPCANDKK